jgi:hypothetical protein
MYLFICYSSQVKCHLSSGVEHFHGKEGVSGSNPEDGSMPYNQAKLDVGMLRRVSEAVKHVRL